MPEPENHHGRLLIRGSNCADLRKDSDYLPCQPRSSGRGIEKFDERFLVLKGGDIREQFGVNQWLEQKKVITSLDLAKRTEILPGLKQAHWDLIIVDEAHRMSWTPAQNSPLRPRGTLARHF